MNKFAALAVAVAAVFISGDAIGQPACVKRTDLVKHLTEKYNESVVAIGLADNGSLVEVFASASGATWTMAISMPNGVSCMIATGKDWQTTATPKAKPKDKGA